MSAILPYYAPAAQAAIDMTADVVSLPEKFDVITAFVTDTINYDYIRAIRIQKEEKALPDVERTWTKKMGICLDIAALTTGMLNAVDIRAYMCFGTVDDGRYHAWVEAYIDGELYRYDHDGEAKSYKTDHIFLWEYTPDGKLREMAE